MEIHYSTDKSVQIVLSLLKAHGIKRIIASPGTTNQKLVVSMQSDPFFEIYSSVDERSAAYIACGLAEETGDPVVITCTGATASRNYMSGLTEAFYRKLPILAITCISSTRVGHLLEQIIDRSVLPKDIARLSVQLPFIKEDVDLYNCQIDVNKAILELKRHGGGPVHINLPLQSCTDYSAKYLPNVRKIDRVNLNDQFPVMKEGKIGVFVGSHKKWSMDETRVLDDFCFSRNAVVFCDQTSNYMGKYRVMFSLVAGQEQYESELCALDILIHIGEVSGNQYSVNGLRPKEVWRVSEDGEIRDTFRKLKYVFEMPERVFFKQYTIENAIGTDSFMEECLLEDEVIRKKLPQLPFSNLWVASMLAPLIPENSVVHFGILNSLRSWNFFELSRTVKSNCNVGGFGIDGGISALLGASLANNNKLCFGIFGDLAFFYDMNVLGNKHVGNNIRILLINNGRGVEFNLPANAGYYLGQHADPYVAASGHFGNQSRMLVKNYAENLGFEYMSASSKIEFEQAYNKFVVPEIMNKPILFELFVNEVDEIEAMKAILNIKTNVKGKGKYIAKQILGDKGQKKVKSLIGLISQK